MSSARIISPSSADRVPAIIRADTLKPMEKVSRKTEALSFTRINKKAENGSAHTMYSAKKLRLTKVDAGLGPCAKNCQSNQNCSAAQSDASTAPT